MSELFDEFRSLVPREYDIERLGDAEGEAFFDKAADHILATTKAPLKSKARGRRAKQAPQPPRPPSVKKAMRRALDNEGGLVYGDSVGDLTANINRLTNVLWKRVVRGAMARAFAEGFKAGDEYVGGCCGCSGFGDLPVNPYTGEEVASP